MKLSLAEARRLALAAQGLDGGWQPSPGKEGAAQAIERLGYVQIDTISVVQRAHHHTLWSRCPDYQPAMLHALQAEERRVFDYWWHAASYLPMCDYRYALPRMRAHADSQRSRSFLDAHRAVADHVMARIRAEGPLTSSDFAVPAGMKLKGWWDWKPARRALEILFLSGELMVPERRGFERVYDLPERVLPPGIDTTPPTADEAARFLVRRVVAGEGVSALEHWWLRGKGELRKAIAELVETGELLPVTIEGVAGPQHYALSETLHASPGPSGAAGSLGSSRLPAGRLHILSPFDPLVIWRGRLRRLFGFDFSLECYQPEAKRRYGYFCLPVLWGDTFVARLDAKAERREKILRVRKLYFEPGVTDFGALLPALAARLLAFARFNECERVAVDHSEPAHALEPLCRALGGAAAA